MICPSCGSPSENKRFCTRCGARLSEDQTPAEPGADVWARQSYTAAHQRQATDALTNQTLDQRYYLEAKLGVGGMGTVYRARRLLIGDRVAVKVLHPEQLADPSAVERFRREAQTAARLKHPNVVTIYDFGVAQEGLIYLVMELVEGEGLRQVIEREGTLIPAAAAEVTRQVCAALDETHRQSVVHRDIKPENIVLQTTPSGLQVKVLDFGVAALREITTSRLTRSGGVVGTPHYMSPEQCMGEELDGRSDIYSLGIVLYEMLTGVVPFNSPTATAIVVQHVNQAPAPLRSLNASIPPEVEAVVLRALEKRRGARQQTAGALARELTAAVSGVASASAQRDASIAGVTLTPETSHAEATTPLWGGDATTAQIAEPVFSNMESATNKVGKFVALFFGLLLLFLLGGGFGYWWYANKNNTKQTATTVTAPMSDQRPTTSPSPGESSNAPGSGAEPNNTPPSSGKPWELISDQTSSVSEGKNALGAPDRQVAVIVPGGQLALAYLDGQFFGDGAGADLRVFGPEQDQVSYIVLVRDDPAGAWRRIDINRRGFPQGGAGHDMGHHGVRQARQVLIKNAANTDLQLDAVTVTYKDTVSGESHPHRHR